MSTYLPAFSVAPCPCRIWDHPFHRRNPPGTLSISAPDQNSYIGQKTDQYVLKPSPELCFKEKRGKKRENVSPRAPSPLPSSSPSGSPWCTPSPSYSRGPPTAATSPAKKIMNSKVYRRAFSWCFSNYEIPS